VTKEMVLTVTGQARSLEREKYVRHYASVLEEPGQGGKLELAIWALGKLQSSNSVGALMRFALRTNTEAYAQLSFEALGELLYRDLFDSPLSSDNRGEALDRIKSWNEELKRVGYLRYIAELLDRARILGESVEADLASEICERGDLVATKLLVDIYIKSLDADLRERIRCGVLSTTGFDLAADGGTNILTALGKEGVFDKSSITNRYRAYLVNRGLGSVISDPQMALTTLLTVEDPSVRSIVFQLLGDRLTRSD
jgi:hypothetical protein